MITYIKSFELKSEYNFKIYSFFSDKILLVYTGNTNKYCFYIKLPRSVVHLFIHNHVITIVGVYTEIKQIKFFIDKLNSLLKTTSPLKKKLFLKGLGFKAYISSNSVDDSRYLNFKLGFSHTILIKIPTLIINVSVKKNILFFQCLDSTVLGNFVEKIRRLRVPDCYKGKGFIKKYEKRKIKTIKKK